MSIQVDMFAVRLGASVLLQFKVGRRTVRVLADAGYSKYDVANKLDLMKDFGDGKMHIDLVIGTHYDGDHLAGLVDVVERGDITIGEAWMPPVADDTRPSARRFRSADLLPVLFQGEDGDEQLMRYLQVKRSTIERTEELDAEVIRRSQKFRDEQYLSELMVRRTSAQSYRVSAEHTAMESIHEFFRAALTRANAILGRTNSSHADVDYSSEAIDRNLRHFDRFTPFDSLGVNKENMLRYIGERPERTEAAMMNLASIVRSTAQGALTATHLKKVVDALRKKNVPIRCETIDAGEPRRFVWHDKDQRFIPSAQISTDGPVLELLGPSDYLVEKYWRRLPVGDYMVKALHYALPYESITPANELSYIMRFEYKRQGILVTGDAGCVDFRKDDDGPYYPKLLQRLLPLHVMQVAHHGGHNAYFYHSLLEAGYAKQKDESLLLLSHGVDDISRPSQVFDRFIAEVRKDGDDLKLLFTSRPLPNKVVNFRALIHKPVGAIGAEGDIRLSFDGAWNVNTHAIKA